MFSFDNEVVLDQQVSLALDEDVGSGDVTASIIDAEAVSQVKVICRETAVICGQQWFDRVFSVLNKSIKIEWLVGEGEKVSADTEICYLRGSTQAILTGERTALNFLQTLSATATVAHHYAQLVSSTGVRILDTRKTIPGLRLAQKYAVTCGGCSNHRTGLYDAILIKENHIAAAGSIANAVTQLRQTSDLKIEVEVESIDELHQALAVNVDSVLLDNFSLPELREAVQINDGKARLEASGGVTDDQLIAIAETGVDDISIGALTKHVRAIDLSMRFMP